jgi:uncharacterized SAM-binding protein YcdF (DUF218 family)
MARFGRAGHKRRWASTIAAFLATLWVGGFIAFANGIPTAPVAPAEKTDAIVVLTGGSLRLETGLRLLEQGAAKKLFVSGVPRIVETAELLRLQKREPDTLQCCIVLGHDADDTVGNAAETAAWAGNAGYRTIRLVTANYHMPRSLLEFRAAMPGTAILAHPVSPENVKHERWYRYPGTAWLIAGEYTKFILAWFRQAAEWMWSEVTA